MSGPLVKSGGCNLRSIAKKAMGRILLGIAWAVFGPTSRAYHLVQENLCNSMPIRLRCQLLSSLLNGGRSSKSVGKVMVRARLSSMNQTWVCEAKLISSMFARRKQLAKFFTADPSTLMYGVDLMVSICVVELLYCLRSFDLVGLTVGWT